MRKLLLLALICTGLACKKDASENITKYNWVLATAQVNPAMTINGKTTTDYKNLLGPGSCLASNYTLSFSPDGTFTVGSNGSLCDMLANVGPDTWVQNGDQLTFKTEAGTTSTATVKGNTLTQKHSFTNTENGIAYTVVYVYKAKSK